MNAPKPSAIAHHSVAVIGGGQAGLSISWYLKRSGIDHVVFEKRHAGHAWRAERWDTFCLVTPNWRAVHRLRRDHLAVDFEHASAAAANPAHVVECKRREPETVVFEVELDCVLSWGERFRAFPPNSFDIQQIPGEHRLAVHEIHPIPAEPPAVRLYHALCAPPAARRCPR